jgi:3-deoxy-manno-octulosonate cytidylyltransferase (CMP-KDO synthetase)
MNAIGIIPARYASQRFPGKLLADLEGQTVLHRVWLAAQRASTLQRIIIACDDILLEEECKRIGAEYVRTDPALPSGTDRIAAVVRHLGLHDADAIVNIQGDEPFVDARTIDILVYQLMNEKHADITTPITRITDKQELLNPAIVKVVLNQNQKALYFSRSPIPFLRDIDPEKWLDHADFWRHLGIYCYKPHALRLFTELSVSPLEKLEKLEQLRLLEYGASYFCVKVMPPLGPGIDMPQDLERAIAIIREIT